MPRLRAVAVVLALVAGLCAATPREAAAQSARFTHLSVEHGLSQSSVQQILQDRRGLLWFGTQEGLNRYDGYRFIVHRARDQDGFLRDHDITALVEDDEGDLWVGTSKGLYRYDLDSGRFEQCAPPVDTLGIARMVAGGDGRIHFATADGRLWRIDPSDGTRRALALDEEALGAHRGVTALARASNGAIWAAAGGALFTIDGTQATRVLTDLGRVSVMASGANGDVWIGRPAGDLLRYRPADRAVDSFPHVPRNVLAIWPSRDGDVWIGARAGGLSRLRPSTGALVTYRQNPDNDASLSGDNVAAIFEDDGGTVWAGSWNGGVSQFNPDAQAFRTLRHLPHVPGSLPADDVLAMIERGDGRLWVISRSGVVAEGDPAAGRFRVTAQVRRDGRMTAIGWWEGRIMIGTASGLLALDTSGRELPLEASWQGHALGSRHIAAIRTTPGAMWMAAGKDLFRVTRPGEGTAVRIDRFALPFEAPASALSMPGHGRLWIGSEAGDIASAEWSGGGATVAIRARESFTARGFVSTLHEDDRQRLWVGTRRGLARVDLGSGAASWLGPQNGLPSSTIVGIAPGADGRLWVGHNRGLTRIDPASGAMVHFGERDGAQGRGYAEGAWTAGPSGALYFAGQGITIFDPRDVYVSAQPPRVIFTSLQILHRPVAPRWQDPDSPLEGTLDAHGEVTLGPGASVFSVEMAPLHYVDPAGTRLMYRLEGFDDDWVETDANNRVATYTNLAPGRYVLRARGGTRSGRWSPQESALVIRILPPWWRTTPALAGWTAIGLLGLGLLVAAGRRRARVKLALLERETLRRESLTDPLTGLHNRRFLVSYLQHEVPRVLREYRTRGAAAASSDANLLLFLIDIDHFKPINDRHSHAAGDRVLARVAAELKEHIRESDLAVRWGGDEFLVVTGSTQRARGRDSAERLRAAVAALGAMTPDDDVPACTLSIGFVAFPFLPHDPAALTWQQTLELADHALRMTKDRQRNSYTGLHAGPHVSAASILTLLDAGVDAPLPAGIDILTPDQ